MPLIYIVAGARPNFMKIAPIVRALKARDDISFKLIHTGQHYDRNMSDIFFEELGIPQPDIFMGTGGFRHSQQMARIMVAFDELCLAERPDAVVVVGDVLSTLACCLVAKMLDIRVAHVEAGLRSGDRAMPEEINRLATDSISDWFFVTEPNAVDNLLQEGKPESAIHYVGQVMVDNLLYQAAKLGNTQNSRRYGVVTLHRPSNVDNVQTLMRIGDALKEIAVELPLVFSLHPRTRRSLERFNIVLGPNVTLTEPQGYMAFLSLWKNAVLVLTDSGGLQEETTALGVPCITIRENTERPITVEQGSNVLAGTDPTRIVAEARKILNGEGKRGRRPYLWDGEAAKRIVASLANALACGEEKAVASYKGHGVSNVDERLLTATQTREAPGIENSRLHTENGKP